MLKKYEDYKETQISYLGSLPSHWNILPLRSILFERKEKNIGKKNNEILSVMANRGVILYSEKGNVGNKASDNIERYNVVYEDDIVLNCMNVIIGSVGRSPYNGVLSPVYYVLVNRNTQTYNTRYYDYVFKLKPLQSELKKYGKGILAHRMRISMDSLKSLNLPCPPIEEQNQVVKYLDWKLAKINKLIQAKKKQIALLNEHKQVIINNAITKGLDSKVSMKNSGIEWIGETPTTWKIKRLKNVATTFGRIGFRGYSTVDLVDNEEDGAITTSPSNIKEDSMSFEKCSYLTWEKYEESPEIQLRENDILIVKTGSSYGKTGFIDSLPKKATINPQLLIVRNRSNELHSKFLYFVIKSRYFQDQIKCEIIGSTIPTISETKILSFFLAIPPKDVQEKLLVYIESVIDKHRLAIKKIEDEISLLQEYRIRLISDVVTGKIDVSDIEIPEYETDSDDFTDDEIDDNLVLDEEDGEMEVE